MIRPLIIPWRTLPHAKHIDRRPLQALCPLSRRDDHSDTAVGDQAAVEEVEGLDDVARV